MSKIDLKDVTFNIPFFYDSDDRVENIYFLIEYLQFYFDTNILVKEVGKERNLKFDNWEMGFEYVFEYSEDPIFHRTKVLNELCKLSKTNIIVNQDTDVICPVNAYITAMNEIKSGKRDIVYPYDGRFMEVGRDKLYKLRKKYDFNCIKLDELSCLHPKSCGGIVFENKEKFIKSGGENENIKGWGCEDDERRFRFKKLNYSIGRTFNYLIHIDHFRGINSNQDNTFYKKNVYETQRIYDMNNDDLLKEISNWKHFE